MKAISTVLFLLLATMIWSQSEGVITYNEVAKLDIQVEGVDQSMLDMLPKTHSETKELLFSKNETLYRASKEKESEDVNISSDDGSFRMIMKTGDKEDILYTNTQEGNYVHQKQLLGRDFLVIDKMQKRKWKITNEKIKYLDYVCQKATIEEDGKLTVAWFTTEIPYQIGPKDYQGLPGAILMLNINDGQLEISAQSVSADLGGEKIEAPDKGKKVTAQEYDEIKEEKMKEMETMNGNVIIRSRG